MCCVSSGNLALFNGRHEPDTISVNNYTLALNQKSIFAAQTG